MTRVRRAELRDIPILTGLFVQLLEQLKGYGQWMLSDDPVAVENGVVAFLLGKMHTEENAVFVSTDGNDQPTGLLVGWIVNYPSFYRHTRVAELQFLSPLSFKETPGLLKAFEKWGRGLGATATSNHATPGNEPSIRCMVRDGRRLSYLHFCKPYEVSHEA
jgi:hypothetical protein